MRETAQGLIDRGRPFTPLDEGERGFAVNLRGQCHHFLGEFDQAEKDYAESISLDPTQPRWYLNRAQYRAQQGKPELAAADHRQAQALREAAASEVTGFAVARRACYQSLVVKPAAVAGVTLKPCATAETGPKRVRS